ncbi:hypothetical protein K440DRAFT_643007 [Wilcoxina mikolae CBS 423.85]|nr:hypothetical protein K440DRAFT_643007 [Wilcoxina mikolae CBS 423.85]
MQFSTSFFTIAVLASALVGAIPQPISGLHTRIPETNNDTFAEKAYKKALKLGIDPHGPWPNDFTSDNGKYISFEENSMFALWVAAQNHPAVSLELKKRASSGIDIAYDLPYLTRCHIEGLM